MPSAPTHLPWESAVACRLSISICLYIRIPYRYHDNQQHRDSEGIEKKAEWIDVHFHTAFISIDPNAFIHTEIIWRASQRDTDSSYSLPEGIQFMNANRMCISIEWWLECKCLSRKSNTAVLAELVHAIAYRNIYAVWLHFCYIFGLKLSPSVVVYVLLLRCGGREYGVGGGNWDDQVWGVFLCEFGCHLYGR